MQVLNEVYFGKVIALQQLEDTLKKLRFKYESDGRRNPNLIHKEINRDPLVAKIANYIKEQFGFGEVIVTITATTKLRASTVSFLADKNGVAYIDELKGINLKDTLVVTREGIRYNKKFNPSILIIISSGILFSPLVSIEELVAVLLHEIGHSFSKATIGSNEFNARIDEKFADQFATMYGYGPELSSILGKISVRNQYEDTESLRKVPILNVFVGLNNIRKALWDRLVDGNVHPTLSRRMNDTIRQLQNELDRSEGLTTKQKKELQANLDKAKSIASEYYNDTPYASDTVFKYYSKNIEPTLGVETKADLHAETYGSDHLVNQRFTSLRKKR